MAANKVKVGNVPNLRFPGFEGEWEEKRFGEIATNKSAKFNPNNAVGFVRCIELEHLASKHGRLLGYVDGSQLGSIKNIFNKGDILFGKLRPYLQKYLQAPFDGVCSSEVWVLKGAEVSNDFLYRLIQTEKFIELANQSSGSKMPRADWHLVEIGNFSLPQSSEQKKISDFLTLIDDRIDTQSKIIEQLETLIRGICQSTISQNSTKKLQKQSLKDILIERTETNSDSHQVFSVSVSKGVINQVDYLGRSFAAKDTSNYNVAHYGDIIYTKSPTGEFPYGIIKQNFIYGKVAVSPLYGVFKPKNFDYANMLHYYFSNPVNTNNYLHSLIQKGAKNTINITNQRFLDKEIYLPIDETEIGTIVKLLSSISQKIRNEEIFLNALIKQKQYLLKNIFI